MVGKPGDWVREPRVADCPTCGSDSMGVRRIRSDTEIRRCDENHEFEAQAYEIVSRSEATRFD